jgi:glutamate 5-kinase
MSVAPSPRSILQSAETIVVKVGSRVLSATNGQLDDSQIASISRQLVELTQLGKHVVLVSSGAVASGVGKLGLPKRPADLAQLQAVAAVGQAHLIQSYERHLSQLGKHAAQILLIADDLDDRTRYLNVRNTLLACLQMSLIPVINENDTVAVEELQTTFGDNDRLAGMVTGLFAKSALIILSDVAGVFDRDPKLPGATVVSQVETVDRSVLGLATAHNSAVSKGGMASKLKVAQFVTQSGAPVVIAGGRMDNVLPRLMAGEQLGTLFLPRAEGLIPRKRWLGFSTQPSGQLRVDDGAVTALRSKGSSLLSIGVRSTFGEFVKGDVVSVVAADGTEVARGLCNYDAAEMARICGLRTSQIEATLGYCPYEEVIHRDNLTIL